MNTYRVTLMLALAGVLGSTFNALAVPAIHDEETDGLTDARLQLSMGRPFVRPGGQIAIDVYATNVADLQAYQISLEVSGGRMGTLDLESVVINETRLEYIFNESDCRYACDTFHGEAGAVQLDGTTEVTTPKLLATFVYRASSDAAGTFTIDIHANGHSYLIDSYGEQIECDMSSAADVAITGTRLFDAADSD